MESSEKVWISPCATSTPPAISAAECLPQEEGQHCQQNLSPKSSALSTSEGWVQILFSIPWKPRFRTMRYDFYFNFKLPIHLAPELRSSTTTTKGSSPWTCQHTLRAEFPGGSRLSPQHHGCAAHTLCFTCSIPGLALCVTPALDVGQSQCSQL